MLAISEKCRFLTPVAWIIAVSCVGDLYGDEPFVPKFLDGEAQVVEAFKKDWIQHDLWVETEFDSDNDSKLDRMHVSVSRPKQTDTEQLKVPAIYQSSPYYAGMGSTQKAHMWNPRQELGRIPKDHETPPALPQKSLRPVLSREHLSEWVPRGFAVVHSSSPGTGLSQGCPTVGGDNESLAPKAVIDWLNGRAKGFLTPDGNEPVLATWCTGKVGMTGTSYNGTLALAAATTGVDGLAAIIPVAPNTSYYHYYRSNGLVRHPGGYMGEDIDVLYNFINSGDPAKRDYCDCNIRDIEMKNGFDRTHGDYNEFWAKRDYANDLGPMKAATLMSHAFNDWNVMPEHSIRIYSAIKARGIPTQLYMHQGGHGGPPPIKLMNRWFTHYLYGINNNVEKDAQSWIVREGTMRSEPTAYKNYPHSDSEGVGLRPIRGGHSIGGLVISDGPRVGTADGNETLVDNFSFSGAALAKAEWSNHRLLYATKPLKQEIHISGTPKVSVRLACNKSSACLSVWLVSLPWTDSERITDDVITRGWADPQNYRSLTQQEPLVPGEFRTVTFDLQPDDQVVKAGEQIGFMIFSSDRDFTLWPEPGTELVVDLDATTLSLPIAGGAKQLATALGEE
ncbi:MAG: Xaa-Pro dipeptidyl-peptidase [Pirellula sp.]